MFCSCISSQKIGSGSQTKGDTDQTTGADPTSDCGALYLIKLHTYMGHRLLSPVAKKVGCEALTVLSAVHTHLISLSRSPGTR